MSASKKTSELGEPTADLDEPTADLGEPTLKRREFLAAGGATIAATTWEIGRASCRERV